MMLQGIPVKTHPKENATWHMIKHMIQEQMFRTGNQQSDPQVLARLTAHMSETQKNIMDIAQNPAKYAGMFIQEEFQREQGRSSVSAPQLGQNLPAMTGAPPAAGVPAGQGEY